MARLQESLEFLIGVNADGAIRAFRKVGDEADKGLGKAEDRIDRTAQRSIRLGAGLIGAAAVGGRALIALGNTASDLEQAVGGSASVFGESADAIADFAQTAADSVGLSERAAREVTSNVGAVLQGFGVAQAQAAEISIDIARRGADAAATFGGTAQEAIEAFGAAIRGETEAARRFGVVVTGGAKGLDAYAQIVEQSATFSGQFAREADTAAGAQARFTANLENLAASLGSAVTPALAQFFAVVSDGVSGLQALNESTGGAFGELATFAAAGAGIAGAILLINGAVLKLRGSLASLAAVNPVLAGLTALAAAGAVVWSNYSRAQEQTKARVEELTRAIEDQGSALEANTAQVDDWLTNSEALRRVLLDTGITAAELATAITEGGDSYEDLRRRIADSTRELTGSDLAVRAVVSGLDAQRSATEAASRAIEQKAQIEDQATLTINGYTAAGQAYVAGLEAQGRAVADAAAAEERRADAIRNALNATNSLIDATLGYESAVDRTEDAIAAVTEAEQASAGTTEEAAARYEALDDARRGAAEAALAQARAASEAQGAEEGSAEAAAIQAGELRAIADEVGGPLATRLRDFAGQLEDAGEVEVKPTVEFDDTQALRDLSEYERRLRNIPRNVETTVTVRTVEIGGPAGGTAQRSGG